MESKIVKSKLLLTTAALLASVSLASAQGMREGGGPGGGMGGGGERGMSSGPSGGSSGGEMSRSSGAQRGERLQTEGRGQGLREGGRAEGRSERQIDRGQAQRGQIQKDQTVGQGQRDSEQPRRSESGRREAPAGAQTRHSQQSQQQDRTGAAAKSQSTTGIATQKQTGTQAPKGQQPQQQSRTGAATQDQTTGAATRSQTGTAAQGQTQGQTQGQAQAQSGVAAQTQASRTTLSAQQQNTIQQSVLSARNAPRVNVNAIHFAVNPGVVVPSNIRIVSVSTFPVLVDVFPSFRDFSFFVVEDEIVFLDRDRRIVEIVPVGPRARFSRRAARGGSFAMLDLSQQEIREVQRVLIERHLLVGEADGVLGPRTREALITFQRQQGIQTTGSIDTRTVTALGLSNRIGQQTGQSATQGQSSTVGQGQTGTQQSTTGQGTGQANAPMPQNQSTTGQATGGAKQPSAQQGTSGQAAPQNQSTVGRSSNQQAPAQNSGQNPSSK
jgi:Putative peptidoglycan binding domain